MSRLMKREIQDYECWCRYIYINRPGKQLPYLRLLRLRIRELDSHNNIIIIITRVGSLVPYWEPPQVADREKPVRYDGFQVFPGAGKKLSLDTTDFHVSSGTPTATEPMSESAE